MKILITGSSGYVGSALAQAIINNGDDEVYTLDTYSPSYPLKTKVTHINLDLTDFNRVRERLKDLEFDVVVHLAAKIRGEPYDIMKINVMGTINLLESIREKNFRLLIAASTAAQLYRNAHYLPIDEKHPVTPVTPYGFSKYLMEEVINYYHRVYGLPTLIFRQTNVYGLSPNQKSTVINKFIEQAMDSGEITIYGDGKQVRNFINMEDLIEYYFRAIYHRDPKILAGETVNIAGPQEYSINEISKIVAEAIFKEAGKQINIKYAPLLIPPTHEIYVFKVSVEKAERLLNYRSKMTVKEGIIKLIRNLYNKDSARKIE